MDETIIQIELEKESLEAYKGWYESIKPAKMTRIEFNTLIFLMGVDTINTSAADKIDELILENPEKYKEALDAAKAGTLKNSED